MSIINPPIDRMTAPDIRVRKGGELIVALIAYHAHMAAIIDKHKAAYLSDHCLKNIQANA